MTNAKTTIEIYTDGSCRGNPGPGGYAAIIINDGKQHEVKGNDPETTNNRMEMMAMIKALEYVRKKLNKEKLATTDITLYSDSNLLVQSLNLGWKRKANLDLWEQLDRARAWLNIRYVWVKAHANNTLNNAVDRLALAEATKAMN